jgi:hypothetical protein
LSTKFLKKSKKYFFASVRFYLLEDKEFYGYLILYFRKTPSTACYNYLLGKELYNNGPEGLNTRSIKIKFSPNNFNLTKTIPMELVFFGFKKSKKVLYK